MKNCLVIVRNKKLCLDTARLNRLLKSFSSCGYYFDKTALVSFDDAENIAAQLSECARSFDNAVVVCPPSQIKMIGDYLSHVYGTPPDRDGVIVSGEKSAFLTDDALSEGRMPKLAVSLLDEKYKIRYDKMYVKCVCVSAQEINAVIERCSEFGGEITYAVYDDFGDVTVEITYSCETSKMTADAVLRTFVAQLGDRVYALENITLAERLYQLLKLRRMKISVTESFTDGGICRKLVGVAGISEVFEEGLNTYSNRAKTERLGVAEMTLKQYGAVSEQTARQMAEGLLRTGRCDVAVATTGIAGPASDYTEKPVGLAYIAVGRQENIEVYKLQLGGNRETVMNTAVNRALLLVYNLLK